MFQQAKRPNHLSFQKGGKNKQSQQPETEARKRDPFPKKQRRKKPFGKTITVNKAKNYLKNF